jgi:hypothetical protein
MKHIPYASAFSGPDAARNEIKKILRQFGCDSRGFTDNDAEHEVLLKFTYRTLLGRIAAAAKHR